jgi:leader peptidase (prepilin peptidase) / N-methyltransferase
MGLHVATSGADSRGPRCRMSFWLALVLVPVVSRLVVTVALRLPAREPVAFRRTVCPYCGTTPRWRDLVPLLRWPGGGRRCRRCDCFIPTGVPVIELCAAVVVGWAWLVTAGLVFWASCLLGWTLLALASADARHGILPDLLTLPLGLGGLALFAWLDPTRLAAHAVAVVGGFTAFTLLAVGYRWLRGREGLGGGDAKLLGAAGAWVGPEGLPSVVFVAAVTALVGSLLWRHWRGLALDAVAEIRFGPYLCVAVWVVWLHGPLVPS